MTWWRANNPEKSFNTTKVGHLRRFRLSLEEYGALLEQQGMACAVCGKPERIITHNTGKPRMLAVDHCHTTGKIRGLLCFRCNTVIGKIDESLETAIALHRYLEKHKKE